MEAHPILTALLSSPDARWGPVIASVTVLDVLLVLLVVAAAARGWHLGLSRAALGVGGLVVGLLAGLWAAARLVPASLSPAVTLALEVGFVLAAALIGSGVGAAIGASGARLLAAAHLRVLDRAAGAIGRAGLALVMIWLLVAGIAALAPTQASAVARTMTTRSALLSLTSQALPVDQLRQRVVDDLPVPADLAALIPVAGSGAVPGRASTPAMAAVADEAAAATVRITATGCAGGVQGSGFLAADRLVVTNAHVIAGSTAVTITDATGLHRAAVVEVDGGDDLAVLRVDDAVSAPLVVADEPVANGTRGVVLGYPGGGPLTAAGAVVRARLPLRLSAATPAVDAGSPLVTGSPRYVLAAQVRPGNSGGPLLSADGHVIGVVNARSLADPGTGYAITSPQIVPVVAAAAAATSPVGTGSCAAPAAAG